MISVYMAKNATDLQVAGANRQFYQLVATCQQDRAANYCWTSDNVRLNFAKIRPK